MIFNIFKSKPTLNELIPNGFVDIHSHILPGIDDGARNIKESILLISEMKKMGFSKIIGTPHTIPGLYDNTNKSIIDSFNKIKIKGVDIGYASEYMLDKSLIKRAEEKKLLTISKNYVLIEFSFLSNHNNLYEILFEIQTNGYTPIIAHPERYFYFHADFYNYSRLKKHGCLFQVNLLSLTNYYGNDVNKICRRLIKKGYVDYIGSDFHSLKHVEYSKKNKVQGIDQEMLKKIEILFQNNKLLF